MKYNYFVIALLYIFTYGESYENYLSIERWNEIANHINNHPAATWKALKLSSPNGDKFTDLKLKVGHSHSGGSVPHETNTDDKGNRANQCEDNGLPAQFDARKSWPECSEIIGHVYDQGNCASWWAVSAVGVFSDRVCIASKGRIKTLFSSQQLISCCRICGNSHHNIDGCHGGWTGGAFQYIIRNGLVSGGDYKSKKGCQPYMMEPCDHHTSSNGTKSLATCSSLPQRKPPKCKQHCYNYEYNKKFKQDIIKAKKYYPVSPCSAMNEIITNGPILANFVNFEDFYTYNSGVYQHLTGEFSGRHAVRVIGWGEENGVPYWLAINSWNTQWGDDGTFKIRRGGNEFSFENGFSAIAPDV